MMIFCMLLTRYTKNLILKSQYSVPNLISELQSDKNKGKQARDIRWRHQLIMFFFLLLETKACLHQIVYLSAGWRYNKGLVHPWDTTTHCRSAIPVWQYLKLNTNFPEAQQTDPPHPAPPSTSITTVVDCDHTKCHRRTASTVHLSRVCHLQGGMGYYKVRRVAGKVVKGAVRPLECPNDALCLKCVAVFQRWHFFSLRKCFFDI